MTTRPDPEPPQGLALQSPPEPMWVFAYGSLLWDPGFTPVETCQATVEGYHRSFSMLSIHHRGTPERPGLVLALDRAEGASCIGQALRVAPADGADVLAYLRERELVSAAYLERLIPVQLQDGRQVTALTYVIDPDHVQYVNYPLEKQAKMIARAVGGRGPNHEYLSRTAALLDDLGIPDPDIGWLAGQVGALIAE